MFRRFILVTHRWIGLLTSAILAIVGGTGVILTLDSFEGYRFTQIASSLHERLAFGGVGHRIVLAATFAAILLEAGGVVLWWKQKTLAVRVRSGWWRACFDLHHAAGLICLPFMVIGAATAIGMFLYPPTVDGELYRLFRQWHVGRFPTPLRVVYAVATLGFVVQGVTGVLIWWKRKA